jgi:hypothetical protein
MHTPGNVAEIGDGTKGTVLVSGSTHKGTTETGDRGDPTSGSTGSGRLRTSDHRASCRREERLRGLILFIILIVVLILVGRDRYHTLNFGWSGRTRGRRWNRWNLTTATTTAATATTSTSSSAGRHNDQRVDDGSLL